MREKVLSVNEAAGWVQDGTLLGFTSQSVKSSPMAFLRELVRLKIRNLRMATLTGGGLYTDLLIGAGAVAEYETCHCSLGDYGPAPNFQRALRLRSVKMKDTTWGVMYSMVQAGSMGLPYIAVRGLLGSDLLKYRPDLKVQQNPFNSGEEVAVAQPIRPEVAVFHGLKADRWGNAVTPGLRDDLTMARASRRVVVTAEEIVDGELSPGDALANTFLPALDVDAVVHAPFGSHPCSCGSSYPVDDRHVKEYLDAAKSEETFRDYLEKYVFSVSNHREYMQRVGLAAVA